MDIDLPEYSASRLRLFSPLLIKNIEKPSRQQSKAYDGQRMLVIFMVA